MFPLILQSADNHNSSDDVYWRGALVSYYGTLIGSHMCHTTDDPEWPLKFISATVI